MASQLLGIKTRFTNDLGSPLIGGQVYTYFAGTSTNQDSYGDAALTVPNTNPVILDDTGSADIFLKGSYRIRVFDKSGRFIEEQDNVTQAASQGDATELNNKIITLERGLSTANTEIGKVKLDTGITATAKFGGVERELSEKISEVVSIKDFGGIGDGALHPLSERFTTLASAKAQYPHAESLTDSIDWAAVQAWYAHLCSAGGHGVANEGDYVLNRPIGSHLNASLSINASGAKFRASTGFPAGVKFWSTKTGSTPDVTYAWRGGSFFGEHIPKSLTGEANDVIGFISQNCVSAVIDIDRLYTGEDWTVSGSDSHFFLAACDDVELTIRSAQGANDSVVYVSRDFTGKKGRRLVCNVNAYRCNVGFIAKRNFDTAVVNVVAQDCIVGAATGQADMQDIAIGKAGRNMSINVIATGCEHPLFLQSTVGVLATVNADKMGVDIPNYQSTAASVVRLRGTQNSSVMANCSGINSGLPDLSLTGVFAGTIENTVDAVTPATNNTVVLTADNLTTVFTESGNGCDFNNVRATVKTFTTKAVLVGGNSTIDVSTGTTRASNKDVVVESATTQTKVAAGAVLVGKPQSVSPAYLDFYSSSSALRDARFIVTGGTAAVGKGNAELDCDTFKVNGALYQQLSATASVSTAIGEFTIQRISNTSIKMIMRGTDGVLRFNTITLAP